MSAAANRPELTPVTDELQRYCFAGHCKGDKRKARR